MSVKFRLSTLFGVMSVLCIAGALYSSLYRERLRHEKLCGDIKSAGGAVCWPYNDPKTFPTADKTVGFGPGLASHQQAAELLQRALRDPRIAEITVKGRWYSSDTFSRPLYGGDRHELTICKASIGLSDMVQLLNHSELTSLRLRGCRSKKTKNDTLPESGMRINRHIERLSVYFSEIEDADVAIIGKCRHLKHLDLSQNRVTDESLRYLNGLPIEELVIGKTLITGEGLSSISNCAQLRKLSLSRAIWTEFNDDHFNKELKGVDISRTRNASSDLFFYPLDTCIKDLHQFINLEYLDLAGCRISAADIPSIYKCRNLQWLNFANSSIGDGQLTGLGHLGNLHTIGLAGCSVSDESIDALLSVRSLRVVDLRETSISLNGVAKLLRERQIDAIGLSSDSSEEFLNRLMNILSNSSVVYVCLDDPNLHSYHTYTGNEALSQLFPNKFFMYGRWSGWPHERWYYPFPVSRYSPSVEFMMD